MYAYISNYQITIYKKKQGIKIQLENLIDFKYGSVQSSRSPEGSTCFVCYQYFRERRPT